MQATDVTTLDDDIIASARPMNFEICSAIPADHPSLAGHFPGAPVVPGAVILDEVAAALAEWRPGCQLTGVRAVKFLVPLKPEQSFTICLALANSDQTEIDFFCRVEDLTMVEGRLQIGRVYSRKVAATPIEGPAFNPQPYDPRLAQWLQGYPASLFSERLYRSINSWSVIASIWRSICSLDWMLSINSTSGDLRENFVRRFHISHVSVPCWIGF